MKFVRTIDREADKGLSVARELALSRALAGMPQVLEPERRIDEK